MDLPTDFSVEDSMSIISLFGLRTRWYLRLLELLWELLRLITEYAPVLT